MKGKEKFSAFGESNNNPVIVSFMYTRLLLMPIKCFDLLLEEGIALVGKFKQRDIILRRHRHWCLIYLLLK